MVDDSVVDPTGTLPAPGVGGHRGVQPAEHSLTDPARVVCIECGGPGRVFVREPQARSGADVQCFCQDCAAQLRGQRFAHGAAPPSLAIPLALAGVVLGMLGAGADWIAPELSAGFGWQQRLGLVVGGFAVLLGAVLRFDLLVVGGFFLFTAAITADWFGAHTSPGVGWKQQFVLLLATLLLLIAMGRRRRWRFAATRPEAKR